MAEDLKITYRVHAVLRMAQRAISQTDVEHVIRSGQIVEQYDNDYPFPSRLLFATAGARPLHVVTAWNPADSEWIVITVYEPTLDRWYPDFTRRKP